MSHLIVAVDKNYGIGLNNKLPWKHTAEGVHDLQYFKKMTTNQAIIMGYNTYISIGKLLPNRLNIIVTKKHYIQIKDISLDTTSLDTSLIVFDNLHDAVKYGKQFETRNITNKCFIIGGAQIYMDYLSSYNPSIIYITQFKEEWNCDKTFPIHLVKYNSESVVEPLSLSICYKTLVNNNIEEEAYLDLFRLLFNKGHNKLDRTNTGTISYFSPPNLEFSLKDNDIPILTTKTVAMKTGVIPELLWFISGSTDTTELEKHGCSIWKGNTSREFLDNRGLHNYSVGELGPGYGFQWRHAGEKYIGLIDDLENKIIYEGKDQLSDLVHQLKTDPDSRRMLMVSWAPAQLDQMALPPCHILYQVYTHVVNNIRYLSAKMYQRSADSFLGVPFNIASYALLTHILAHLTGYTADRIVFTYGDYHIYNNHIKQVKEQLSRSPRPFPKIRFLRTADEIGNISNVTVEDIQILGYNPHPKISALMAV